MSGKSFKEKATAAINPAFQFISSAPPIAQVEPEHEQEQGNAPGKRETKARRLQLLIKPSTHAAIKAAAEAQGISVNEWINNALEAAIK